MHNGATASTASPALLEDDFSEAQEWVDAGGHLQAIWSASVTVVVVSATAGDTSDRIATPCMTDTGGAATSRFAESSDGEDAAFYDADRQLEGDMTAEFPAHA